MTIDAHFTAEQIEASLRAAGTPERAANEKRYLKSELDHAGATVPDVRAVLRAFTREHRDLTHDELTALVGALWSRPVFECRLAAALLLTAYPRLLGPDDLGLLQRLVRDSRTWALVDVLAGKVLGTIVATHPDAAGELDAWAADPDFWVRRSALLSQMQPLRVGTTDFSRFGRYADAMLDEREFFIRKAIGWVLRDVSRRDSSTVYEWLAPRIDRASGVTVREAVKYLAPDQRAELLAAYGKRRGRPAGRPRTTT
jgi:3-methyladenine DNA glycosylase AlkD